jgi:hypothetical protein
MNYDDWKAHDPRDDEDYRMPSCATPGCDESVTFPTDTFCSACLVEHERQRTKAQQQRLHETERRSA